MGLVKDNKGITLPIVMVLLAIILLLCFTLLYQVDNETLSVSNIKAAEGSLHIAEAGFNQYLWYMNDDSKFYNTAKSNNLLNTNTAFENGYYRLGITKPGIGQPELTIVSTGWLASSPSIKKTIEVKIRKRQFVQNIYVSENEKMVNGDIVWWVTGDTVNGPLHTNGNLNIQGSPTFNGLVTYVGNINKGTGYNPAYNGGGPNKVTPLVFPEVNQNTKSWAILDGYYYTGRTSILLKSDGNLVIKNKDSAAVTRSIPTNGVIYVDGGDDGTKWGLNNGNAFVSGTLNGKLTIVASNDIYITGKDPTNYTYTSATATQGIVYENTNFSGGNITDDMLGLIANDYIRVLHYGWFGNISSSSVALNNITIQGSLFAKNYSFEFEDYDSGSSLGYITLTGSITQQYRGAVGIFSGSSKVNGYSKNYTHDSRLMYDYPPHFAEPANAGWEVLDWKEIANP